MSKLIAIDVAILPPPDVAARAIQLSAALPDAESKGLRLGGDNLPHVTLTQQFVRRADLDVAIERIDGVLAAQPSIRLRVPGSWRGSSSVWMLVERSEALLDLHRRLMEALRDIEVPGGNASAFADKAGRPGDVAWVRSYRTKASFGAFTPHITLGHARSAPDLEPLVFDATTVAACHLGRFCTCRTVLKQWTLTIP